MPYHHKSIKEQIECIPDKIKNAIFFPLCELDVEAWVTPEPVSFEKRRTGERRSVRIGESWGKVWDCAWFHFTGKVPDNAAGKKIVLLIDLSGEAYIADESGNPIQGLTTVTSEFDATLGRPGKRAVYLYESAKGGELIDLWADAGCNDLFGNYSDSGILKEACIAACNEQMRQLYHDFNVLHDLLKCLPEDKARYYSILNALNDAALSLCQYTGDEAVRAREILKPELRKKCGDPSLKVSAIGHAHIDLAWLWPIRETIRKGARSFSTALANMERYPDYVFGASQPQLYQWIKDYYPGLYGKVKEKITEGRWEVQGAMWVEADTNLPGGESLVRQLLYGKRFFYQEFEKDVRILWLPDVFGYTAALPQILKKAGVDFFATIKLSWSAYNKHPHHTFYWEGIDGSRVLAHMPPEGTYNSSAAPRAVVKAERDYLDKGASEHCLLVFGIGDGGGGPGEEHLEMLAREKDLNGIVPVTQESSLEFFKKLEKEASHLKHWHGELYLEYHQGTYTTNAANKRYNRKMEFALRELEFASVLAMTKAGKGYPQKELEDIWKEILLYQFHDILPGSSIKRVYEESQERYAALLKQVAELTNAAYASVANRGRNDRLNAVVCNSLSWIRKEWVSHEGQWHYVQIPPMSIMRLPSESSSYNPDLLTSSRDILENDLLKISFTEEGFIKSVYDKENQREAIDSRYFANVLNVYEDEGNAWDFPTNYDEKIGRPMALNTVNCRIDGPKAVRRCTYIYGQSTMTQEVILPLHTKRIDFISEVEWKEENRMLRTSFPVNVFTTEASCDIQFGNLKRATHVNTSWEMAKHEVCAHKWVDMSQPDYGVALLNDCKYGHKLLGNTIDLNLIRSGGYPYPNSGIGFHKFTYSLYPHCGDEITGRVARAGYELNIPLSIIPDASLEADYSMISIDKDNVVLEAVKKAEDSDGIILRMYECHGADASATIKLNFPTKKAVLVNLMEDETEEIKVGDGYLKIDFKPFEIQSLKLYAIK